MARTDGSLTPEDHIKLQEWWKTRWTSIVKCPVCSNTKWSTNQYLLRFDRQVTGMSATSITYPQVNVGCDNCGYSMFFNATQIGITSDVG